ncbi:hypothetical protein DPMN_081343 [Dreissena polymorpha]|uniref:Uncharacterized protein n=1 Tax=Dreissena polymorpha TaxID=45954 RepID=A0A9D3Y8U5_DREPO|nr:hypothetical protein DPMN_081343 [Dreissena polymorpha]
MSFTQPKTPNLTPLLGEALSGLDRHHLTHSTMPFKGLPQSVTSVGPIMSLLSIFQLASCLAKQLPGLVERTVPLASGCVFLQLKSAQSLATLLSKGTLHLGRVAVQALAPSNMRLVHGHIAGIPESQGLVDFKKCLSFNSAISVSDLLITYLERVEPYRSPPSGFSRLVKISFLTSVPVPTQIFVKDTYVALDIRPCRLHLPGVSIVRALATKGCPSYQKGVDLATYANFYGVTWSEAECRLFAPDTVSHSAGTRNTITRTGSTLSPEHASIGIISPKTGRTCLIVEGLVSKSTPP